MTVDNFHMSLQLVRDRARIQTQELWIPDLNPHLEYDVPL